MSAKKCPFKTPLPSSTPPEEEDVIFVSPEGIKSLEAAIENLEHIYNEMGAKAKTTKIPKTTKTPKPDSNNNNKI
ncbi:MAG: hypothetical protein LBV38_04570 [Alistipes sp.]|jgi:hypothetical protein|nr:hypothetical protein [Alistipes sp.]